MKVVSKPISQKEYIFYLVDANGQHLSASIDIATSRAHAVELTETFAKTYDVPFECTHSNANGDLFSQSEYWSEKTEKDYISEKDTFNNPYKYTASDGWGLGGGGKSPAESKYYDGSSDKKTYDDEWPPEMKKFK